MRYFHNSPNFVLVNHIFSSLSAHLQQDHEGYYDCGATAAEVNIVCSHSSVVGMHVVPFSVRTSRSLQSHNE
jgi:hypothetical protein